MNRNHLKIIACVSMLCDHVGYLLFPQAAWLRYVGRLAFPLFAFFIGEGCRYTRNRKKYCLGLLILSAVCQLAYGAEELITGGGLTATSSFWYFNVVFTFFLASLACFLLLDLRQRLRDRAFSAAAKKACLLALYLAALSAFCWFAWNRRRLHGWSLCLDYGMCGILLPMSAALFEDRRKKLFAFSLALLVYCFVFAASPLNVWFSLLCVPLLLCYNGQGGSRKLKYFFYVFYPAHLGLLYLISLFL